MYGQGHHYWKSCILITSSKVNNRRFGTGFIVCHFELKSYIITCAHIINDIGEISSLKADGQPARIIAIGSDDGLDLAVIQTGELVGRPIIPLGMSGTTGSPFITAGFRTFGRHFSLTPLHGRITAPVSLESNNYQDRINAWHLAVECDERLNDGYSGSPVIDETTGFCIGVISYKQRDGQAGLAVSIDELLKIWQTMPVNLIGKPCEYKSYHDSLFSRATQSYITGDLAEALHLLQRIKSVEPSYPRLDIMIRSIQDEISKKYVDRYGQVKEQAVLKSKLRSPSKIYISKDAQQFGRRHILIGIFFAFIGFLGGLLVAKKEQEPKKQRSSE